jgi:NADH pyrophosphatase NudC (nudix superfamily)
MIFDWLKEEANIYAESAGDFAKNRRVIPVGSLKKIINEAEAKWESEVCEWKREESYPYRHLTNCGRMITHKHKEAKFCCFCGKPIKISEVE